MIRRLLMRFYGASEDGLRSKEDALNKRINEREQERQRAIKEARSRYVEMRMKRAGGEK